MSKNTKSTQNAFTLLELMVVIAIISILASFSVPKFTQQITKAKLIEVLNLRNAAQSKIDEHILFNDSFPNSTDFDQLITEYTLTTSTLIDSISVENIDSVKGDLKITLKESLNITSGNYITMSRHASGAWACTTNLAATLIPEDCTPTSATDDAGE